jgi:hypothetical protein
MMVDLPWSILGEWCHLYCCLYVLYYFYHRIRGNVVWINEEEAK